MKYKYQYFVKIVAWCIIVKMASFLRGYLDQLFVNCVFTECKKDKCPKRFKINYLLAIASSKSSCNGC